MLLKLRNICESCKKCSLSNSRTNVVFGGGNPNARVMFIGEAPGANEDASGLPFVGRSGKLLDEFLEGIGLDRSQIYIANMIKCRPPQNRNPNSAEMNECLPYLQEQIELIKPEFVVCLGRVAACRLISPDFKVTRSHGEFYPRGTYEIMGTFHPAAIIRTPGQKPSALRDFQALKSKLMLTSGGECAII